MKNWQLFENEIANVYRMIGFEVTENIEVAGQQIDLLCRQKIPGIGWLAICVECKFAESRSTNSLSNQEVQNFASMFHSYKDRQGWTAGILISNKPFSSNARAAAEIHHDIYLKTIRELYDELLRIHAYLQFCVHRSEASTWFDNYVPLNARLLDRDLRHTALPSTLKSVVDTWMGDDSSRQLCILGDFGSGKTTFLRHTLVNLAKEYLAGRSQLIPLFIPLREYYDAQTAEDLVERFFARECGARIHPDVFFELLSSGRFLMLLDGFDEMGASSSSESRKANYMKLARFITRGQKAIITCRPAYFPKGSELVAVFSDYRAQIGITAPRTSKHPRTKRLARFVDQLDPKKSDQIMTNLFVDVRKVFESTTFAEVQLFNDKQLLRYLKGYDSQIRLASAGAMDAQILRETIKSTYDLEDLAHRPILLKLIVSTVPSIQMIGNKYMVALEGKQVTISDITPSILYHLYTENELRREEEERGSGIRVFSRARKAEIISALANAMREKGEIALSGGEFQEAVRRLADADGTYSEAAANEIRTCSFLVRDHRDCVRFTHKSFYEYYAALHLCKKLGATASMKRLLGESALPIEVSFFLGDLVSGIYPSMIPKLRNAVFGSWAKSDPLVIQNCITILNYARSPISDVRSVSCERIVYEKLQLRGLQFRDCNVREVVFKGCRIDRLEIANSRIGQITNAGEISDMDIRDSHVGIFNSTNGKIAQLTISGGDIEASQEAAENSADLMSIGRVQAANSVWWFRQHGNATLSILPPGSFVKCILFRMFLGNEYLRKSDFRSCTFSLCRITEGPKSDGFAPVGSRGVMLKSGIGEITSHFERVEEWTSDYAWKVASRKASARRWEEALVQRMYEFRPRTGEEIRQEVDKLDKEIQRLRQS